MHLTGKNRKISFIGRKLVRNEQIERRFMFMKIFWAQVVVCPCPRAIHVYDQNIQSSFENPLANQSQTLCGAKFGRGNESLHKLSRSHDQDGHHGYKQQKPLKSSSSEPDVL